MNILALYGLLVLIGIGIGSAATGFVVSNYYKVELASCNDAIEKINSDSEKIVIEHAAKLEVANAKAEQLTHDNEVSKNESSRIINNLSDSVRLYQERHKSRVIATAAAKPDARADGLGDSGEDTKLQNSCIELIPESYDIAGIAERCIKTTLNNCGIAK